MCGCKVCKKKIPKGHKPQKWDKSGEFISCPNCKFKKHSDWWQLLSYTISESNFKKNGNK